MYYNRFDVFGYQSTVRLKTDGCRLFSIHHMYKKTHSMQFHHLVLLAYIQYFVDFINFIHFNLRALLFLVDYLLYFSRKLLIYWFDTFKTDLHLQPQPILCCHCLWIFVQKNKLLFDTIFSVCIKVVDIILLQRWFKPFSYLSGVFDQHFPYQVSKCRGDGSVEQSWWSRCQPSRLCAEERWLLRCPRQALRNTTLQNYSVSSYTIY